MKPLCCLLLLEGLLCGARAAARPPAASAPASEHPVVGVELRGDTMVYRTTRHAHLFEDEAGRLYRLRSVLADPVALHTVSIEGGAYSWSGSRSPFSTKERVWVAQPPEAFPTERYYYEGPLRTSGMWGLAYGYRLSRAVEVGVSLSYAAYWRDLMRAPDRSVASSLREHYVTLMPFARFMWLNRRSVQLYTAVQLGCQWGYEKSYTDGYGSFTYLTGQFTPFGIRVGRRLFGYVEWGIGARGLFVGGVGYSFGNFKR